MSLAISLKETMIMSPGYDDWTKFTVHFYNKDNELVAEETYRTPTEDFKRAEEQASFFAENNLKGFNAEYYEIFPA